jgi:thiol:disulfide interchange protein
MDELPVGLLLILMLAGGVVMGGFCAYIAGQKNRDPGGWFAVGFFFSLLALIAIAAVPAIPDAVIKKRKEQDNEQAARQQRECQEQLQRENELRAEWKENRQRAMAAMKAQGQVACRRCRELSGRHAPVVVGVAAVIVLVSIVAGIQCA